MPLQQSNPCKYRNLFIANTKRAKERNGRRKLKTYVVRWNIKSTPVGIEISLKEAPDLKSQNLRFPYDAPLRTALFIWSTATPRTVILHWNWKAFKLLRSGYKLREINLAYSHGEPWDPKWAGRPSLEWYVFRWSPDWILNFSKVPSS